MISQPLGERRTLEKIDTKEVTLHKWDKWYIEDEKLLKMIGKICFECREINMILKLDQYKGDKGVHCNDKSNVKWLLEELATRKAMSGLKYRDSDQKTPE